MCPVRSVTHGSGPDHSLARTITDCSTVVDPKLTQGSVLYVPADFQAPQAIQQLETKCNIKVDHLPGVIHHPGELNPRKLEHPGLLYLENRYVVPGGRFNEMYGWDSQTPPAKRVAW